MCEPLLYRLRVPKGDYMDGRMLYFECYSGISGDMAVAAMLDLDADREALDRALSSLDLKGFRTEVTRVSKSGLDVCDFNVILDEDNHDHDSEYLYGHGHAHGHTHGDEHHIHEEIEHPHHHGHRGLPEILSIIDRADMTEKAKSVSKRIFDIIGEAEAKAHGVPLEQVHFHEVGAVDSVVDIVSLGVCIDSLGVSDVCFSDLYEGTGCIRCQHGVIPVPAPAVVNIAEANGLRLRITDSAGEYVTPTGAAFAAAVRTRGVPRSFRIDRVGMGAGKRESERSGILRAMLITPAPETDTVVKLECNVDDCTGEALGFAAERLMREGARDAHYTPVFMKKGRPAYMLTVICSESDRERLERLIFEETSTVGIRRSVMDRTIMDRRIEEVDTPIGRVQVKVCTVDGIEKAHPEYESLAAICREKGIPYRDAYETVMTSMRSRR